MVFYGSTFGEIRMNKNNTTTEILIHCRIGNSKGVCMCLTEC